EPGAWRYGGPESGVVRSEVPCRSAPHTETANQDPVFVDAILLFHRGKRLKQIHFTRELVGIAESSVEVQHDCGPRREFPGFSPAVGKEVAFAQCLSPPMEPRVEPPAMRRIRRERGRHY